MSLVSNAPICFIPTNKPEEARRFYEETLGLTFIEDDQFAIVFHVGTTKTMLRVVRAPNFEPCPFTIFGWETRDIEATVDDLKGRGVEFLRYGFFEQDERGIWRTSGAAVAWFKDPDGNTLSVSKHE